MTKAHPMPPRSTVAGILLLLGPIVVATAAAEPGEPLLERRFEEVVRPFLKNHCLTCHGAEKPKGKLDLSVYSTAAAVARNHRAWDVVLERLEADEMPPEEAPRQP